MGEASRSRCKSNDFRSLLFCMTVFLLVLEGSCCVFENCVFSHILDIFVACISEKTLMGATEAFLNVIAVGVALIFSG